MVRAPEHEGRSSFAEELSSLSALATEVGQLGEVLRRAARALQGVLPATVVAIVEVTGAEGAEPGFLLLEYREGDPSPGHGAGRSRPEQELPQELEALCREHLRELSGGDSQGPAVRPLKLRGLESCLLIPVQSAGTTRGFVAALADDESAFESEHVTVARLFASIVGVALECAERAGELQVHNQRLAEQARLLSGGPVRSWTDEAGQEGWQSPAMIEVMKVVKQVAVTDASVLLTGETGVGKDELARTIHQRSKRREGPYVVVNCAALPAELIESELFGHARGAFSGAVKDHLGRFEVADGGTLLLDEIGDMPLGLQPKLLRVLQEGEIQRVGESRTRRVDVRVLASTNSNLEEAIEEGRFRQDLYYRIGVFHLVVPPLRQRMEDLPVLCQQILDQRHRLEGRCPWELSERALAELGAHDWPGNIRELVNALERSCILSRGPELEVHLTGRRGAPSAEGPDPALRPILEETDAAAPGPGPGPDAEAWPSLQQHIRGYMERVLVRTRGRIYGPGGAAELLGVPPTTLQSRLKRMGVDRHRFAVDEQE